MELVSLLWYEKEDLADGKLAIERIGSAVD